MTVTLRNERQEKFAERNFEGRLMRSRGENAGVCPIREGLTERRPKWDRGDSLLIHIVAAAMMKA
jgi:hypothetical protein